MKSQEVFTQWYCPLNKQMQVEDCELIITPINPYPTLVLRWEVHNIP